MSIVYYLDMYGLFVKELDVVEWMVIDEFSYFIKIRYGALYILSYEIDYIQLCRIMFNPERLNM